MRLLYVTSNSLPSRIIRGIDGGPASHVGIESPLRPGEVIDATWLHGGAWADETLSSRAYRAHRDGKFFGWTMRVIDLLFVWQTIRIDAIGHCHNAYLNEADRTGCPPELR